MDGSHRAHARVRDTESTTIATVAVTERAGEVFGLEAEVLLIASAQSLEDEMTATIAATVPDAMTVMTATDITIATATMTAMIAADDVIGAEIVDALIVDTRPMRSMTTSLSLIPMVTDRLFSVGRRPPGEGTIKNLL